MIAQKMPKIALLALSLGIVVLCQPVASFAKSEKSKQKHAAEAKASEDSSDEAVIKTQLLNLAKTLVNGDAKRLAALWADDGTYIDSDGALCKGRAALEKRFESVFTKEGRQLVDFVPETTKFLSPQVASIEGIVRRKDGVDGPVPETRFSIVYVKQSGVWLISSASETPLTAQSESEPLKELSWLIGEWSAEANGGYVKLKADWAANKHFITMQYETKKSADAPQLESRQVIGWDPRVGEPISWHFDSSGGFGLGNWVKKDKQWMIEASGVDRDGSTNEATTVISQSDDNDFTWQSINRVVNGVSFNDSNPLKVHRVLK